MACEPVEAELFLGKSFMPEMQSASEGNGKEGEGVMKPETEKELREAIEKMKEAPWDYTHLHDCSCGSDDLDISETDDGNFNFYAANIWCNSCGKEVTNSSTQAADEIWNAMHPKKEPAPG